MAINTKGNANTKPGTKKGNSPKAPKKAWGANTEYAKPARTKIKNY